MSSVPTGPELSVLGNATARLKPELWLLQQHGSRTTNREALQTGHAQLWKAPRLCTDPENPLSVPGRIADPPAADPRAISLPCLPLASSRGYPCAVTRAESHQQTLEALPVKTGRNQHGTRRGAASPPAARRCSASSARTAAARRPAGDDTGRRDGCWAALPGPVPPPSALPCPARPSPPGPAAPGLPAAPRSAPAAPRRAPASAPSARPPAPRSPRPAAASAAPAAAPAPPAGPPASCRDTEGVREGTGGGTERHRARPARPCQAPPGLTRPCPARTWPGGPAARSTEPAWSCRAGPVRSSVGPAPIAAGPAPPAPPHGPGPPAATSPAAGPRPLPWQRGEQLRVPPRVKKHRGHGASRGGRGGVCGHRLLTALIGGQGGGRGVMGGGRGYE